MSCEGQISPFIEERTLIYLLTTTAFIGIFIFLYIQSTFSYLDRRKINRGPVPQLPFGNIKDVILQKTPFFIHLWKYYNRFKRKGYYFGGLYLFLKPAVLVLDKFLVYTVLTNETFNNTEPEGKINSKAVSEHLFNSFLQKDSELDLPEIKNFKINESLKQYCLENVKRLVGVENLTEIVTFFDNGNKSTFWSNVTNCYPLFSFREYQKRKVFKQLEGSIKSIVAKRKKDDLRETDLIQILMEENLDMDQIVETVYEVLVLGYEYCYNTCCFCLYELCDNTDIQEELVGEIRRFNKEGTDLDYVSILKLQCLETVFQETVRKYPPYAFLKKICKNGYKNDKYKLDIPSGCFTLVSVYGVHHDASNYIDPEQFDPDRFAVENKQYIEPYTFMPFGMGPDSGTRLKLLNLLVKSNLVNIFSNYKVTFGSKCEKGIEFDSRWKTPRPKHPLLLDIEEL